MPVWKGPFRWEADCLDLAGADMARTIRNNRSSAMEMAIHAFEVIYAIGKSSKTDMICHMKAPFTRPKTIPAGYYNGSREMAPDVDE